MGEIADQIINGECCELCLMPFEEEYGYPVVCQDCWDSMTPKQRESHQLAPKQ